MPEHQQLLELRELFLVTSMSTPARVLLIAFSVALALTVLWLVRRRRLREEYTPIWLAAAAAVVIVAIRVDLLYALTRAIGAWAPSSTIFFVGEVFLLAICLNFAVRLSTMSGQIKNLAQEVTLLRARLEPPRGAGSPRPHRGLG